MAKDEESVREHYGDLVQNYTDAYDAENLWNVKIYPAAHFRLVNFLNTLRNSPKHRVLDAGCGEGSPLIAVAGLGHDVRGFDFTDEMVETAKRQFSANDMDPAWISKASIEDYDSFAALCEDGPFDTAICFGVLPHVNSELNCLRNMHKALRKGGTVHVSFRNELFNMFTFNRFTYGYIMDSLLGGAPEDIRETASAFLEDRVERNIPPLRVSTERGKPGYDAIKAKMHNPLDMPALFENAGFRFKRIFWYHFHPIFPMLEGKAIDKRRFREAAFELEKNPFDTRGAFLCSAFVVEATAE